MQSHIREYCDELQQLNSTIQNKAEQISQMNVEHRQILNKLEVLEEENTRLYETEERNIKLHQRIRAINTTITSLQSHNFDLQSNIQQLKKRRYKVVIIKMSVDVTKIFAGVARGH